MAGSQSRTGSEYEREGKSLCKKEDSAVARTARALKIKSGALALLLSLSLWLSLSVSLLAVQLNMHILIKSLRH